MNREPIRQTKFMTAGLAFGLALGGLAGFIFGFAIDELPLWLILGAGGGMVIGLAGGSALDRLVEKRSEP